MNGLRSHSRALLLAGIASMWLVLPGCSEDMVAQPSYQPQEAPRLHSPEGSIPRRSRSVLLSPPPETLDRVARGASIFDINCAHCHGKVGMGDGPVAPYLALPPFNLRRIRRSSALPGRSMRSSPTVWT